jgi:hypothetical protein
VKSKEEAIEWVKRAPRISPNGDAVVEIRELWTSRISVRVRAE